MIKLGFNGIRIFEFWLQTCKEEISCLTNIINNNNISTMICNICKEF